MKKSYRNLCTLIATAKTEKEADLLLRDLLTPQEMKVLAERWEIVQELAKGKSQRLISKRLRTSISTVTRGSLALQYGSKGFLYFLKKLGKPFRNFEPHG